MFSQRFSPTTGKMEWVLEDEDYDMRNEIARWANLRKPSDLSTVLSCSSRGLVIFHFIIFFYFYCFHHLYIVYLILSLLNNIVMKDSIKMQKKMLVVLVPFKTEINCNFNS